MARPNPSKIALLAELPGLEAAKEAITARIAEIRRHVYGEDPAEQRQIRRRTITEETREQRRQFLAKARQAKLQRLSEKKAQFETAPLDVKVAASPEQERGEHTANRSPKAPEKARPPKRK